MGVLDTINSIGKRIGTGIKSLTGYSPNLTNETLNMAGNLVASPYNKAVPKPTPTPSPIVTPALVAPAQSSSKPTDPLVVGNSTSNPIINTSIAPIVRNDVSSVVASAAGIQSQIAQIQQQLQAAQKAGYSANDEIKTDAQGNPIPKQPTQPEETSILDKLLGIGTAGQKQIDTLPAVPGVDESRRKILESFGYTEDSFKKVAGLSSELLAVNQQIQNLETEKNLALDRVEQRPGISLEFMGGEQNRIEREYNIRAAGLGGKASAINAAISALTGAWDKADKSAKDYVAFATAEKRQLVEDIRYSMDFYKDVYSAMEASEQKRMNDILDFQSAQLQLAEKQAQNDIMNDLKQQGLDIQMMLALNKTGGGTDGGGKLLSVDEAIKLGVPYGTTQAQAASAGLQPIPLSQLGVDANKTRANANSGLSALKTIEDIITKNPGALAKNTLSFGLAERTLGTAKREIMDVLTRLRTGAALNKEEWEFYTKQLPDMFDNSDTRKYKINLFRDLFSNLSGMGTRNSTTSASGSNGLSQFEK